MVVSVLSQVMDTKKCKSVPSQLVKSHSILIWPRLYTYGTPFYDSASRMSDKVGIIYECWGINKNLAIHHVIDGSDGAVAAWIRVSDKQWPCFVLTPWESIIVSRCQSGLTSQDIVSFLGPILQSDRKIIYRFW